MIYLVLLAGLLLNALSSFMITFILSVMYLVLFKGNLPHSGFILLVIFNLINLWWYRNMTKSGAWEGLKEAFGANKKD